MTQTKTVSRQYIDAKFICRYIDSMYEAYFSTVQIEKLMIDKPAIQEYLLFDEDYLEHFVPKKGAGFILDCTHSLYN